MQIAIADVLGADSLAEIRATLAEIPFEDGARTAGWSARAVKDNEQAREGATLRLLRGRVEGAILGHELFQLAARPRALTPLLFSRYRAGRAYGSHVDNALIGGLRTDLSFTLFLSEPDSYEGGELVIEGTGGEDEVKLPAGHLFLYPATALHRVAPVRAGERLAAVGWAQSWVREADRRELLFDLEKARRGLFAASGSTREGDLLAKCAANLMRMWAAG